LAGAYLRRRAETPDGAFEAYVSGGASLKVLDPRGLTLDSVQRAFIQQWVKRDSIVWDIGANLGLFAFPAALKAKEGKVFAFEPNRDVARQVERTLRLPANRGLNIAVECLALSDHDGTAEFEVSAYGTALSRLKGEGAWLDGQVKVRETRTVVALTMDTLAASLPPPAIVKLDVEGAEMRVLEGGRATLARHRPVMLIEGHKEISAALALFLAGLDYAMLDGADGAPITVPAWDTVAVPREKYQ
jgi:FkbM family methyltransferase